MNWAEYTLMGFGILTVSSIAGYCAVDFSHSAWKSIVHWKRDYQMYSNAYGRGFQDGYDAFRKDAGLPPLPSKRIPKNDTNKEANS